MRRHTKPLSVALLVGSLLALARPVAAHVGGLTNTTVSSPVPTWLTVLTGGAVVGVSFLLTSIVTDHELIRGVISARIRIPAPSILRTAGYRLLQFLGVAALAFVIVAGLLGPSTPTANAAILLVWAGWWAGFTMTTYVVGNTWPAVDPVRTIARLFPAEGMREYPEHLGAWPSVVGLLALVYFEVVTPVASAPTFLAIVVLAYVVLGLAGSILYGRETWFGTVDPVARVFRVYGRFAPIQRTADGLALRLPGNALADDAREHPVATGESVSTAAANEPGQTAFVVTLLWVTTYDGLVATPLWKQLATPIVTTLEAPLSGTPASVLLALNVVPLALYLAGILAGFGIFLGIYRTATRWGRQTADTFVDEEFMADWFAPALVPIAAGYHLAHFIGYFLTLSPALLAVMASPLAEPATLEVVVLPTWWGSIQLLFVLVGHLIAVWVAHALAFELFPGILTPLRSQYPLVLAMVVFTMTSAWIVTQPFGAPPFV